MPTMYDEYTIFTPTPPTKSDKTKTKKKSAPTVPEMYSMPTLDIIQEDLFEAVDGIYNNTIFPGFHEMDTGSAIVPGLYEKVVDDRMPCEIADSIPTSVIHGIPELDSGVKSTWSPPTQIPVVLITTDPPEDTVLTTASHYTDQTFGNSNAPETINDFSTTDIPPTKQQECSQCHVSSRPTATTGSRMGSQYLTLPAAVDEVQMLVKYPTTWDIRGCAASTSRLEITVLT